MKKFFIKISALIAIAFTLMAGALITLKFSGGEVHAAWSGNGDGTSANPYQISSKAELEKFRDIVNGANGETRNVSACAILTADINLENEEWIPFANTTQAYKGTFDGNNKKITGLNINTSSANGTALFAKIENATIKNLSVYGNVTTSSTTTAKLAGIVGTIMNNATESRIENCSNYATITSSTPSSGCQLGGIVATAYTGTIINCANYGNVTYTGTYNQSSVGGIIGQAVSPATITISKCSNHGNVQSRWYVGGILGYGNGSVYTISDCYSVGDITGVRFVGGISGYNSSSLLNCHNYGKVTITDYSEKGSIYGENTGGTITNCYYLTGTVYKNSTLNDDQEGPSTPGKALSADAFKLQASFENWDFTDVWMMGDNYPEFIPEIKHTLSYTASGATITAVCSDEECTVDGKTAAITIYAPEDLEYTGQAFVCTLTKDYNKEFFPNPKIKYYDSNDQEVQSVVDVGSYTAKLQFGDAVATLALVVTPQQPMQGDGTAANPYQIKRKDQLEEFRDIVNGLNEKTKNNSACAVLLNDIDLEGDADHQWIPFELYLGTFDGKGHTISGIVISVNSASKVALFSSASGNACIKNLTVSGSVTNTFNNESNRSGGAAGILAEAKQYASGTVVIENCINNVTVSGGANKSVSSAGIVAWATMSVKIKNCVNTGSVSGLFAGGIIGETATAPADVSYCSNTGAISGSSVAGIAGDFKGTMAYCYNSGNVNGTNSLGGLVGTGSDITIHDCYNLGVISGGNAYSSTYNGGLVGTIQSGTNTISNCFNYGNLTRTSNTGSLVGKNGITVTNCYALTGTHANLFGASGVTSTDSDFISADDFKVVGSFKDWDFSEVWEMASKHPVLLPYAPYAALDTTVKPDINVPNDKEHPDENDVISVDTDANPITVEWYYDDDNDGQPDDSSEPIDTKKEHTIKFPEDSGHVIIAIVKQPKKPDESEYPEGSIPTVTTNPVKVSGEIIHIHKVTYTASGDTITATCTAKDCPTTTFKLKLLAPTNLTLENYGDTTEASIEAGYDTEIFPNPVIKYYVTNKDFENRELQTVIYEGHWVAKVTFGNATAKVEFDVDAHFHFHDGYLFTAWTSTDSLPEQPGNYYLANDVILFSHAEMDFNGTLNLCLNGHGIVGNGTGLLMYIQSDTTEVNIYDDGVNEHKFTVAVYENENNTVGAGLATVDDSLTANYKTFTGGYLTGGKYNNGGAIYVVYGVLNIYGGTIIGNNADTNGGAVYVYGGKFSMHGGSIIYNHGRTGGAVFVDNQGYSATNAKFNLYKGEIKYNYSTCRAGAIFTRGDVTIAGGEISNNFNHYEQGNIAVWGGKLIITGGTIANNASSTSCSGIYMSVQNSYITMNGNPTIKDNLDRDGKQANIFLNVGDTINLDGKLTNTDKIGITAEQGATFTSGWINYMYNVDPNEYFYSEVDGNYIGLKNGEATLFDYPQVAQVAGNTYSSLQAAYAGCETDGPIVLLTDIDLTSTYLDEPLNITKDIRLDLNGKVLKLNAGQIKISGTSVLTVDNSKIKTGGIKGVIEVTDTASILFKNARLSATTAELEATSTVNKIADGFKAYDIDENGFKTIIRSETQVAKINGVLYPSLKQAYEESEKGEIIVLVSDIDLTGKGKPYFTIEKDITIDLNGHIITVTDLNQDRIEVINANITLLNSVSTAGGFKNGFVIPQGSKSVIILDKNVRLPFEAAVMDGSIEHGAMEFFAEGLIFKNINSDKSPDANGFVSIVGKAYTPLTPEGTPTINKPDHTPVVGGDVITVEVDGTPVVIKWYYDDDTNGEPDDPNHPIGTGEKYIVKCPDSEDPDHDDRGHVIIVVIKQEVDENGNPYEEGKEPTQVSDPILVYTPINPDVKPTVDLPHPAPINGDVIEIHTKSTPVVIEWFYDDNGDGNPDDPNNPIGTGNTYIVKCPDPDNQDHDDTGHTIIGVIKQEQDENGKPYEKGKEPTQTTDPIHVYTPLDSTDKPELKGPEDDKEPKNGEVIKIDTKTTPIKVEWYYDDDGDGNPDNPGHPIGTGVEYEVKCPDPDDPTHDDTGHTIIAVIKQDKKPDGTDYPEDEVPTVISKPIKVKGNIPGYNPLGDDPSEQPVIKGPTDKDEPENGDVLEIESTGFPVVIEWYYDDDGDGFPDNPGQPIGVGKEYEIKCPDEKDPNHDDTGHTIIGVITQTKEEDGTDIPEDERPTQITKPIKVKGNIPGYEPLDPTPAETPVIKGPEDKDEPENGDVLEIEAGGFPVVIEWFYDDDGDGFPDNPENPIGKGSKYEVKCPDPDNEGHDDTGHTIIGVITQTKNEDGTDIPEDERPVQITKPIKVKGDIPGYNPLDPNGEKPVIEIEGEKEVLEVWNEITVDVDSFPVVITWYYDDDGDGNPDDPSNPLGTGKTYTPKCPEQGEEGQDDRGHKIIAVITQPKKIDGSSYPEGEVPTISSMPVSVATTHTHEFTYVADGATITATCKTGCPITEGLTLTLVAPENLEYDGKTKNATLASGYSKVAFPGPIIKYYLNGEAVIAVKEIGTYVAKVTVGGVTAEVTFEVTKGTPEVNPPKGVSVDIGEKLSDIKLPEGYRWANPDQVINKTGVYTVVIIYTPTDSTNYNEIEIEIKIEVVWDIKDDTQEEVKVDIKNNDGVEADTKVSIKVEVKADVKVSAEAETYTEIEKTKVEDNSEITFVYSVKLIRTVIKDGEEVQEEIQPSDIKEGTIVVITMNIPDELKGKNFKVLHIHNDKETSYVDYRISDDGNSIIVEVDKLSEFAFVTAKDTNSSSHGFCIGYVVLIFVILALLCLPVYIILYFGLCKNLVAKLHLDKLNNKLDLIGLICMCVTGAIFIFALVALIVHQCAATIVSFILAFLICGAFLCLFLLKKLRKNEENSKPNKPEKVEEKEEAKAEVEETPLVEESETKDEPVDEVESESNEKTVPAEEASDDADAPEVIDTHFEVMENVKADEVDSIMSDEVANALIVDERKEKATGKKGIVNVDKLTDAFNDGDTVTIDALKEKGLVANDVKQVKLLAYGSLNKKLNVELQDYSIEAAKMVILAGGTVKRV